MIWIIPINRKLKGKKYSLSRHTFPNIGLSCRQFCMHSFHLKPGLIRGHPLTLANRKYL